MIPALPATMATNATLASLQALPTTDKDAPGSGDGYLNGTFHTHTHTHDV